MKLIAQAVFCMALTAFGATPPVAAKKTAIDTTVRPLSAVTPPNEIAPPKGSINQTESPMLIIIDSTLTPVKTAPLPSSDNTSAVAEQSPEPIVAASPSPENRITPSAETDIERMLREAQLLRVDAQTLRAMADTLQNAADDAEENADRARDKADDLEEGIIDSSLSDAVLSIKADVERIKRRIKADIERIKADHGKISTVDSLTSVEADSIDILLSHIPADSTMSVTRQKMLLREIRTNSEALQSKSRAMSYKAREMEEAADKREDRADDLEDKAAKMAEEQNMLPLTQRYPFHFGFALRFAAIGPYDNWQPDVIMIHGMFAAYSVTPRFDLGIQDIGFYTQQTVLGQRFAISGAPTIKANLFLAKRFQIGAMAGAAGQIRFGKDQETAYSAAPFIALYHEFWVRNHFSISPTIRFNYAARGVQFTTALSQHSGTLPEGAAWMDFGIGYNFNF